MKRAYISLIAKVIGNINADMRIGTRITIKKVRDSQGNEYPFVSSRSIRYGIRKALQEKGFLIDPLQAVGKRKGGEQPGDTGDPVKYVDNDLFGFMSTKKGNKKGEGDARIRISPIKMSYLLAIEPAEISVEIAGKFPRTSSSESDIAPYEIEVANFIGKLDTIIEQRVGLFVEQELEDTSNLQELSNEDKSKIFGELFEDRVFKLPDDERKKRIKAFVKILLETSWPHPRATQHGKQIEPLYAMIVLSDKLLPFTKYFTIKDQKINLDEIMTYIHRLDKDATVEFIDYSNPDDLSKIDDIANQVADYLV